MKADIIQRACTKQDFLCFIAGAWVIFTLLGCGTRDEYVINVDLKSNGFLEGKKVYLGEQATKIFLDSAVVKNGKFQFRVKTDPKFVPFQASMLYATGDESYPFRLLGYKNPYKKRTFMSNFYVERGIMNFALDTSSKIKRKEVIDLAFLNINTQTACAFKHWSFKPALGNSGNSDSNSALIIKQFPTSQHLLKQIDWYKNAMKDTEVNKLLSLFDKSVHNTPAYARLAQYIDYQNNTGNDIPGDVAIFDTNFLPSKLNLDRTRYNLIVFWASWCGPCRQEIPQIAKLLEAHRNNLNVVSLSIDQNEKAWLRALNQEKMPWPQMLLRRDSSFVKFDKKYGLGAIPVSLLFDPQGKLVSRELGIGAGENAINERLARLISGKQ